MNSARDIWSLPMSVNVASNTVKQILSEVERWASLPINYWFLLRVVYRASFKGVHTYTFNVPPESGSTTGRSWLTWQKKPTKVDEVSWRYITAISDFCLGCRTVINTISLWDTCLVEPMWRPFAFMMALERLIPTSSPECIIIGATSTFDRANT